MIIKEEYPLSDLTGKIIGCAMEVHRHLGNGFQEVIYQRALEIEMRIQGLEFSREHEMEIFYKEQAIGLRRVDFFVEGKVMVELKAIIQLEDVHLAQAKIIWKHIKWILGCSLILEIRHCNSKD